MRMNEREKEREKEKEIKRENNSMSVKRTNSFKKLWTDRQIRDQTRSHLLKQRTDLSIDLQPLPLPHGQIKHAVVDPQVPGP